MSISNWDSSPGERKDRGPGEQWANGRVDTIEARETQCFFTVVPTRRARAKEKGGGQGCIRIPRLRPEASLPSCALPQPQRKGRALVFLQRGDSPHFSVIFIIFSKRQ